MSSISNEMRAVLEDPSNPQHSAKLYQILMGIIGTKKEDDLSTLASEFYGEAFKLCSTASNIQPATSIALESISSRLSVAPYHLVPQYTTELKNALKEKDPNLAQLRLLIRLTGSLCSCCDAPSGISVANLPSMSKFKDIKVKILILQNFASIVGNRRNFTTDHLAYVKKALQAKDWSLREAGLKAIADCCDRCEMECAVSAVQALTKLLEIGALSEVEYLPWARAVASCIIASSGVSASPGAGRKGWGAWFSGKGDSENGSPFEQLDSLFKAFVSNKSVLHVLALCTGQILEASLVKGGLDESFEEVFVAMTTPSQKDDRSVVAPYLANGIVDWCQALGNDSLRVTVVKVLLKSVGTKAPKGRCLTALYAAGAIVPMLFSVADVAELVLETTSGVISHPMIPMSVSNAAAVVASLVLSSRSCPMSCNLIMKLDPRRALGSETSVTYLTKTLSALLSGTPSSVLKEEIYDSQFDAMLTLLEELSAFPEAASAPLLLKLWRLDLFFNLTSLILGASSSVSEPLREVATAVSANLNTFIEKLQQLRSYAPSVASLQGAPKVYQQVICSAASAAKVLLIQSTDVEQVRPVQLLCSKLLDENPANQFQAAHLLMDTLSVVPPRRGEDAAVRVAVQYLMSCTMANVYAHPTSPGVDLLLGYSFLPSKQRALCLDSALTLLSETASHSEINVIRSIFAKIFDVYAEVSEGSDSIQRCILRNVATAITRVLQSCLKSVRSHQQDHWDTQPHLELASTLKEQLSKLISLNNKTQSGEADPTLTEVVCEALACLYYLVGAPTVNPQQLMLPGSELGPSGSSCLCHSLIRFSLGINESGVSELALNTLIRQIDGLQQSSASQTRKAAQRGVEMNSPEGLLIVGAGVATCSSFPTSDEALQELLASLSSLFTNSEIWYKDTTDGAGFEAHLAQTASLLSPRHDGIPLAVMSLRSLELSVDQCRHIQSVTSAVQQNLPHEASQLLVSSFLLSAASKVDMGQRNPFIHRRSLAIQTLLQKINPIPQQLSTLLRVADSDPLKTVRDRCYHLIQNPTTEGAILESSLGQYFVKLAMSYLNARPQRFEAEEEEGVKATKKTYEGESGEGGRGLAKRPQAQKDEIHSDRGGKLAAAKLLLGLYKKATVHKDLHQSMHTALFSCCSLVEVVPTAADTVLDILGVVLGPQGVAQGFEESLYELRTQFHTAFRGALTGILEQNSSPSNQLATVLKLLFASKLGDDSSASKALNIIHTAVSDGSATKNELFYLSIFVLAQAVDRGWKTTLEIHGKNFLELDGSKLFLCQLLATSISQRSLQWNVDVPKDVEPLVISYPTGGAELFKLQNWLNVLCTLSELDDKVEVFKDAQFRKLFTTDLCCQLLDTQTDATTVIAHSVSRFVADNLAQDDQAVICQTLLATPALDFPTSVKGLKELCAARLPSKIVLSVVSGFARRLTVVDVPEEKEAMINFLLVLQLLLEDTTLESTSQDSLARLCFSLLELIPLDTLLSAQAFSSADAAKLLIGFMNRISSIFGNLEAVARSGSCPSGYGASTWFCCVLGLSPSVPLTIQNFNAASLNQAHNVLETLIRHESSQFVELICRSALGRHTIFTFNLLGALHLIEGDAVLDASQVPSKFEGNTVLFPLFAQSLVNLVALLNATDPMIQTKVFIVVSTVAMFSMSSARLLTDAVRRSLHTAMTTIAASCRSEVKEALQQQPATAVESIRGVLSPTYLDGSVRESVGANSTSSSQPPQAPTRLPSKKLAINISSFQ